MVGYLSCMSIAGRPYNIYINFLLIKIIVIVAIFIMLIIINIHGGISVMHVNRRAALLQGRVSRGRHQPIIISSDLAAAQNMIVSGNLIVYGNLIVSGNLIVYGNLIVSGIWDALR